MRTYPECVPCFLRQAIETVRQAGGDEAVTMKILKRVGAEIARADLTEPPARLGQTVYRIVREETGNRDPYREAKRESNRMALALFPEVRKRVRADPDPFGAAVRAAAAGNVIDLGIGSGAGHDAIDRAVEDALHARLDESTLAELKAAATAARRILYVGDNSGEIVLDRLLVERLGPEKVVYAVRGGPIINDATREDAEQSGMAGLAKIIDNGDDAPGIIPEASSDEFKRALASADLVIAKGQGNYETLGEIAGPIFLLLRAKCPVLAQDLSCKPGDICLTRTKRYSPARSPAA